MTVRCITKVQSIPMILSCPIHPASIMYWSFHRNWNPHLPPSRRNLSDLSPLHSLAPPCDGVTQHHYLPFFLSYLTSLFPLQILNAEPTFWVAVSLCGHSKHFRLGAPNYLPSSQLPTSKDVVNCIRPGKRTSMVNVPRRAGGSQVDFSDVPPRK